MKKQDGIIYLASPYTDKDPSIQTLRYDDTVSFVTLMLTHGVVIFSPIVYCHNLALRYNLPTDARYWMPFNRVMQLHCKALWVYKLDGYQHSKGVLQELLYAEKINQRIAYIEQVKNFPGIDTKNK